MTNNNVIYTCITGHYDELLDPEVISNGFDYICYTDDLRIKSNVWGIRPLPEECNTIDDIKKQQRFVKLNPHLFFSEYKLSIYVDANIKLVGNVNTLLNTCNLEKTILIPKHPTNNCIYRELGACLRARKDILENMSPQIERYKKEGFPKYFGLTQNNIIIRKHNDKECVKVMEGWWEEIKNGSYRDQLSLMYVIWKLNFNGLEYLDKKLCDSEWFEWLRGHGKKLVYPKATKKDKGEIGKNKYIYHTVSKSFSKKKTKNIKWLN